MAPEIFTPFFFHSYCGLLPPFVITEVNVTLEPAQTLVCGVDIVIVGVTGCVTVRLMVFEVAVKGDAHAELEVSTQVIWSLFTGEANV